MFLGLTIISLSIGVPACILMVLIKLMTSENVSKETRDKIAEHLEVSLRQRINIEMQYDEVTKYLMMLTFPYLNILVLMTIIYFIHNFRR